MSSWLLPQTVCGHITAWEFCYKLIRDLELVHNSKDTTEWWSIQCLSVFPSKKGLILDNNVFSMQKRMNENITHADTYFHISSPWPFLGLSENSRPFLSLTDIHRHFWELSHGDSFPHWGFSGHHDGCLGSCCVLEGKLERIFSKILYKERVTQRYVDPIRRFSSLPSGEPDADCVGPHNQTPAPSPTQTSEITLECNVWFQFHLFPSYLYFCVCYFMPRFLEFLLSITYSQYSITDSNQGFSASRMGLHKRSQDKSGKSPDNFMRKREHKWNRNLFFFPDFLSVFSSENEMLSLYNAFKNAYRDTLIFFLVKIHFKRIDTTFICLC